MSESSHKIYRAVVSSEVMDELMVEPRVILPTDVTHRFHKVLRLKNGAAVEVIDGSGRSVRGLLGIAEQQITLLEPEIFETGPKPPPLWLAQALIRPNKLEPLIQKATEMGMTRIVLWEAERGEARWYSDKDHKRSVTEDSTRSNTTVWSMHSTRD